MRWAWAAVAALAGCVATGDGIVAAPPSPEVAACRAPGLQYLVGQPDSVLQTMRLAGTVRIIRPGMAITQDFSPSRVNVQIAPDGRIARVWCG
jgi:hypothetical protein